jgi:hypothetical protein
LTLGLPGGCEELLALALLLLLLLLMALMSSALLLPLVARQAAIS